LAPSDPQQIGRYELVARLGQGGMGIVYLGRDYAGRSVAVKVLRSELSHDDEFRGRFRSEVNRAREVPPFCTAEMIDADLDHLPPYLVVEYVDGPTLTTVIKDRGGLRGSELHSVAVGIAIALTAIHGAGVIHRDLKPGNVLLAVGGVKVIDFGIARPAEMTSHHTRTDQMVGTVAYMAPERFESAPGQGADLAAADIFSWGAVVMYAATGRTPFAGDSPSATAMRILTQPPDLTGLEPRLLPLVTRALDKDPARRPTAGELLEALLANGQAATPVGDAPPRSYADNVPAKEQEAGHGRRTRWMAVAGCSVAVLGVAAAIATPRLLAGPGPGQSAQRIQPAAEATSGPAVSATPSPTPATSALTTTSSTPFSAATARRSAPSRSAKPAAVNSARTGATYQIESAWAHAIMEVPGVDNNHTDGARVDLADNKHQKDQYWRMPASSEPGYVLISNAYNGMSLSTENASTDNFAKLVQTRTDRGDPHQQWRLEKAGDGTFHIFNRASGKAIDLLGEERDPPFADGTSWNTYFVQQYDLDPSAKDMLWILRR
jgi:serine/threonine protein kinase